MSDFKEFERQAWEQKASRYDSTWGQVSTQSIREILALAKVGPKTRLLDVGCGPGHLCQQAVALGAVVSGCDYSEQMLKIAQANYPQISFCHRDAGNLSFPAGSFDVVSLNYLLLHVPDQEQTLLEAARVLGSPGKIIYSVWLPPSESPGLALMFNAVKKFADLTVIPPAQDIFTFANLEFAREFLAANQFSAIEHKRIDTYWQVDSADQFFSAVQAGTRIGGTIDLQQPQVKEQIRQQIVVEIEGYRRGEHYYIPTPSLIVSATKAD